MSVLTNRKDITQERSGVNMSVQTDPTEGLLRAIADGVHKTAVNTEQENVYAELGVTDREPGEFYMRNFPVKGSERYLVRRTGDGGQFPLTTTATLIVPATEYRMGGLIVNAGANPVLLFLAQDLSGTTGVPVSAVPTIFLPVGGSGWNMLLGNKLWLGNIQAASTTATSSVTVALI